MGLRTLAGDMARNTSGLWRGIADAVDPDGRPSDRVDHIDLTDSASAAPPADMAPADPTPLNTEAFQEQGGQMIVPLDTWTRILEQVGNVHEAGQQLADARERAARAETENHFLHEQLTELKSQRRPARRTTPRPAKPSARADASSASTVAPAAPTLPETVLTRARRRASTWLSP